MLRELARRTQALRAEAAEHETAILAIVRDWRPDLLAQPGVGPIVAATVLCARSHPGRIYSEAAFAMLAGVAPIPANSGQTTTRYRLNRHGDRQLNRGVGGRQSREARVRPDVAGRLRSAVAVVREHAPVQAYSYMYGAGRIKYLGGAFFTKWLYFVSAVDGPDTAAAAPILDKRVVVWLNANTALRLRVDRPESYRQYYQVLGDWGSQFGRTRPQVEQAIFELTRQ